MDGNDLTTSMPGTSRSPDVGDFHAPDAASLW
jgi:hypothetical protein